MKKIIFLFLIINVFSCKNQTTDGIIIGDTLLAHQSLSENRKIESLISKSLNKEKKAIVELINFPNVDGEGSYELGYVLTQIIYRIGENDFAKLLIEIPQSERNEIEGLIAVGLEYGDNDYDGEMDDKRIAFEFPKLIEILKEYY